MRLAWLIGWTVLIATGEAASCADDLDAYRGVGVEQNRAMAEAPMLAVRVERGELPPIDQRLPENPLVVPVYGEPGLYGGTWRKFDISPDLPTMKLINGYTPLVRWKPDVSGVMPGLAERWEFSADGRKITFHLRRGVKWSDGHPFTSESVAFWWALCLDDRHPDTPPEWAFSNGKRVEVSTPDPYTVVFEYEGPFYFLPLVMATGFWTPERVLAPAHYLREFHPDHNPAYEDFTEMERKRNPSANVDLPALGPWEMSYLSPTADRAVFTRNPYYHGVDPEGRQLPYIDQVECIRVQSPEAGVLYAISGSLDAQFRLINFQDYALLKRFAEKGDYKVHTWEDGSGAWHTVYINWSTPDPRKRELFRDPSFRRGLSHAIDRERINQIIWQGTAEPRQATITDEAWHFNSPRGRDVLHRWKNAWARHDLREANELLDAAGLTGRDDAGFRTFPGGEPLELVLDIYDIPHAADQAELIKDDWKQVGLRVRIRQSGDVDLGARVNRAKFEMYLRITSELDLFTYPSHVFPTQIQTWHPAIGRWYTTGGEEGEAPEPGGVMDQLLKIYEQTKAEPDLEKRHGLVLEAIELHLEHGPFMIGTTGRQKHLVVTTNAMRNVPTGGIMAPWATSAPGSLFTEQMYYDASRLYGDQP